MSRRPSFQFYTADWFSNPKLKRCTHAEKGMWADILCLLHDGEPYGVLRWPLTDIARAIGATVPAVSGLVRKGVLKGSDTHCESLIYVPRSGRKNGAPVTLIEEQDGPIWYSSRMVTDEHKSGVRGGASNITPNTAPKTPIGEVSDAHLTQHHPRGITPAAPSSSTSSADKEEEPVALATVVRSAKKSVLADESEFQEFYNVFPLHKARGGALKAYLSARKKGASHEILVRGAASYADHCRRTGTTKQFTAHPATWLNEQRWLDDLSDDQPAGARPGRPTGGYRQGGRSDVEIIADLVAEAERQEQGGGLRLGDDDDGFFGGLRVVS
jgi:hypothetical protein